MALLDPEMVLQRLDALESRLELVVTQQELIMAQLQALGEQVGTLLQHQAAAKLQGTTELVIKGG